MCVFNFFLIWRKKFIFVFFLDCVLIFENEDMYISMLFYFFSLIGDICVDFFFVKYNYFLEFFFFFWEKFFGYGYV